MTWLAGVVVVTSGFWLVGLALSGHFPLRSDHRTRYRRKLFHKPKATHLAQSWLSGGKDEDGANCKGRWRSSAQASLVKLKNLRIHAHSPLIERTVPGIIKDEANQSASIRPGSI